MKENSNANKENTSREELEKKVKDNLAQRHKISKSLNEISQENQRGIDTAENFLNAIEYLPKKHLQMYSESWSIVNRQLESQTGDMWKLIPLTSTVGGTVNIFSSDLSNTSYYEFDPVDEEVVNNVANNFTQIQDIDHEFEKISKLILKLDLNNQVDERTPIQLLETSYKAYSQPITIDFVPIDTSAIPLRTSINSILDTLTKKKKEQVKTSGQTGKVRSIGDQLFWDNLNADYIENLANEWSKLNNQLSGTKSTKYSRDEWRQLLFKGLSFLKALLSAINPDKFR